MKDNKRFDIEAVLHIAQLARLDFSESELERICADMNEMIALADCLGEVGDRADGGVFKRELSYGALREDTVCEGIPRGVLLSSAQSVCDGFVVVPRVLGEGDGV